jgi:hypothetical protein
MIFMFFALTGCREPAGKKLGATIPPDASIVSLEKILETPVEYDGRNVVMKGIITSQCPSLCEFVFREGAHKATIFPSGYKFPKLESGKKVTVYAQISNGPEQVVFSALGLKLE